MDASTTIFMFIKIFDSSMNDRMEIRRMDRRLLWKDNRNGSETEEGLTLKDYRGRSGRIEDLLVICGAI